MLSHRDMCIVMRDLTWLLGSHTAILVLGHVINANLKMGPQTIIWPYPGWNRLRPHNFECDEDVWRRMKLAVQDMYIDIASGEFEFGICGHMPEEIFESKETIRNFMS